MFKHLVNMHIAMITEKKKALVRAEIWVFPLPTSFKVQASSLFSFLHVYLRDKSDFLIFYPRGTLKIILSINEIIGGQWNKFHP